MSNENKIEYTVKWQGPVLDLIEGIYKSKNFKIEMHLNCFSLDWHDVKGAFTDEERQEIFNYIMKNDNNDISWNELERCRNGMDDKEEIIIDGEIKKLTLFRYQQERYLPSRYFSVLDSDDLYENKFFEVKKNNDYIFTKV